VQGAAARSVYLPAGKWIDLWRGQVLTGPLTTNWPAPISQIPAFYRDNSVTPLGPYVQSSQFDDGSQRGLRIYCSTNANYILYDDDGASNGYRSNQFATTSISAAALSNVVAVSIGGAAGSYVGQPTQRIWQVELYCTNSVSDVVVDGAPLSSVASAESLASATSGYYLDGAEHLLRMALPVTSIAQPHFITAYFNPTSPPPYEARINGGGRPYLDRAGTMWVEDHPYSPGSFGIDGGSSNMIVTAIAGTDDDVLYQSEHLGTAFTARFDCPNGTYETSLYNAETHWTAAGQRLFNVAIQGQQVLNKYDIFVAAGGANKAVVVTLTNTVSSGQLQIDFTGVPTAFEVNARVSAIRVRKIADPVFESVPPAVVINSPTNGSTIAGITLVSGTASDNVGVAKVEVSIDSGGWFIASGTTNWSYSLNTIALLNGSHTIFARATDGSGNTSVIPSATVRIVNVPGAYLARISAGNPSSVTDCAANVWIADQNYAAGSFGYVGGTAGFVSGSISNVCSSVYPLYQRERYSTSSVGYGYLFDCPPGIYETTLLEAETYWSGSNQRVFNVFIQGQQVLTNFDIFAVAGGKNIPVTRVFTSMVAGAQHEIDFLPIVDNARASGVQVRKIADLDSDGDGIPDWWMLAYFNHPTGQEADHSMANENADGDSLSNLQEFLAGTDPINNASVFGITSVTADGTNISVVWTSGSGRTNVVQVLTAGVDGSYSNNFSDWSQQIILLGTGVVTTNYLDLGGATNSPARYYRIRLVP
jgi:hypothetical protein